MLFRSLKNDSQEIQYKISKARIVYNTNEEVITLDSSILLSYEVNLLTQTIDSSTEGVLFFLVPSEGINFLELSNQNMTLILDLSNGESLSYSGLIGN